MDAPTFRTGRRAAQVMLIAAFLCAISLPLAHRSLVGQSSDETFEKRHLAELPPVPQTAQEVRTYPLKFEAYFNDQFGTPEITTIAAKHAKVSESVVERSLWAHYDANGRVDVRSLQDQHDFWQARGLVRKGLGDVMQIIDYSYLDAALAQLGTR